MLNDVNTIYFNICEDLGHNFEIYYMCIFFFFNNLIG